MKKLLFFLAIAATGLLTAPTKADAQLVQVRIAQSVTKNGNGTVITPRIMTNVDTISIGTRVTYPYEIMLDYKMVKGSGTVAGTVTILGTNDSVNGPWYALTGNTTACPTCKSTTFSLTDVATQTATWFFPHFPFCYVKGQTITSGTVTATPTVVIRYKN